ncbi:MAG: hypothetical protein COU85_01545 [Candidatus Portnoybacteria bacterium CG10_big_fil_rev_8_21_14_0_10_44_7]|uniref:Uncharacterized protein n=1 Tax=Candidatus Portnoybacteria bacterium CG10_big_fil_rev_8_21_14_0_10_44_7 TaxID=1974816 RepID=A0A2M8KIU1_9BACT|nr:MAG: hypothetical protein COU85_01545 [Candidatus Portnoybacteria bacterium CG10_big_fil_rev_8_21_14_0_10_44_7]
MFTWLAQIIKKNNNTVILVEDGRPAYVVLPFAQYQQMVSEQTGVAVNQPLPDKNKDQGDLTEVSLLEKINKDIEIWKAAQKDKETLVDEQPTDPNEITIEKIPY